ncbi:class I tRNA ligase family protein, partial [Candidatus Saccharibacteria bacterium]|nr:class I tRNA ligase family protein [Candidatus Saccharibacteria bacterium]
IATPENRDAVEGYIRSSANKSEVERQASKEKSGVFTGSYVINPINGEQMPIWVADYVLGGYGTGAVMAVPAHDERDHEFATKFDLSIKQVVAPYFPPDPGEEWVEGYEETTRNNVAVMLKHWSEDKYLCLKWKVEGKNWQSLVMGGVEDGETPEQAAKREVAEETGYTDINIDWTDPINYISKYCAEHKKLNRTTNTCQVFATLNSDQMHSDKLDDENHDALWVEADKVLEFVNLSNHKYTVESGLGLKHDVKFGEVLINSAQYDGLSSQEAKSAIVADLVAKGFARTKINYKMRDWSVSRQRYWGAPIPIVNCADCGPVLIPDDQLPVVLPELTDFAPSGDGRSALARATDWLQVTCPQCGGDAERETDTLDTYICSSWYMLRYLDPHNQEAIFDPGVVNKWMPVDFYNGGDHATAHLLYARFVTRFLHKQGLVSDPEPFKQMLFNGKVTASDGSAFSKTLGNGPDPLEIIA